MPRLPSITLLGKVMARTGELLRWRNHAMGNLGPGRWWVMANVFSAGTVRLYGVNHGSICPIIGVKAHDR